MASSRVLADQLGRDLQDDGPQLVRAVDLLQAKKDLPRFWPVVTSLCPCCVIHRTGRLRRNTSARILAIIVICTPIGIISRKRTEA